MCHPTRALPWDSWVQVHEPKKKKGWALFYQPAWISALGTGSNTPTETFPSQKPAPLSTCILLALCRWRCSLLALGHPHLLPRMFCCGCGHTRAPQCKGFKLSWRLLGTAYCAMPNFPAARAKTRLIQIKGKPSGELFDLLLLWFLCNQWEVVMKYVEWDHSNHSNRKALAFRVPRSLFFTLLQWSG